MKRYYVEGMDVWDLELREEDEECDGQIVMLEDALALQQKLDETVELLRRHSAHCMCHRHDDDDSMGCYARDWLAALEGKEGE